MTELLLALSVGVLVGGIVDLVDELAGDQHYEDWSNR